ncbi:MULTISPECIES: phage head closure protein [unclassified Clostridioides]|uniref:phage head closure protein n=1 Tax=unclassified Clostridioides TaxID=2635829 RepID=UPI001D116F90|nr:phage head closure protein [Clostridioides sp. ES-S-0049-03]MCC0677302.1 phage head closure protein [Clostridioides sp. ES-W-0018-02]MCC0712451.1 phage head closure protein [Clostridioides sp. ES-W-0017-02]
MDVGKLTQRIEVQVFGETENIIGEVIKGWATYKTLWANKSLLRKSSNYILDKEGIEYSYRFKVRYRTDITEDMRIVHDGVIYDIKHVNNIKELNQYETNIDCVVYKEGVYNE